MSDYSSEDQYLATKAAELPSAGIGGGLRRVPPVRKILEAQIAEFEKAIEIRKDLLVKLDSNKGVEEVLDALRKVGI